MNNIMGKPTYANFTCDVPHTAYLYTYPKYLDTMFQIILKL